MNTSDAARGHVEKCGGGDKDISKGCSSFFTDQLITSNNCRSPNFITKGHMEE